jgi:hypothetical protein
MHGRDRSAQFSCADFTDCGVVFTCLWIFLLKVFFLFQHTFVLVIYIRFLTCLHLSMNILQK